MAFIIVRKWDELFALQFRLECASEREREREGERERERERERQSKTNSCYASYSQVHFRVINR